MFGVLAAEHAHTVHLTSRQALDLLGTSDRGLTEGG